MKDWGQERVNRVGLLVVSPKPKRLVILSPQKQVLVEKHQAAQKQWELQQVGS